jgi:hypothetical protein
VRTEALRAGLPAEIADAVATVLTDDERVKLYASLAESPPVRRPDVIVGWEGLLPWPVASDLSEPLFAVGDVAVIDCAYNEPRVSELFLVNTGELFETVFFGEMDGISFRAQCGLRPIADSPAAVCCDPHNTPYMKIADGRPESFVSHGGAFRGVPPVFPGC